MKKLVVASIVAVGFLAGCGPTWGECKTCKPGEESAVSVDGNEEIPVVVNVTVNVNQNQSQTQTQSNTPGDAGTPCPPKKECRTVCVKYEERVKCNQGWHHSDHKGQCKPQTKKHKVCIKEETQCQ